MVGTSELIHRSCSGTLHSVPPPPDLFTLFFSLLPCHFNLKKVTVVYTDGTVNSFVIRHS